MKPLAIGGMILVTQMSSNVTKIGIDAIKAAQNGCPESLSFLTEQTKGKVFTFLYRMTLDYHLSEDLCQETMLNLIKSIHNTYG